MGIGHGINGCQGARDLCDAWRDLGHVIHGLQVTWPRSALGRTRGTRDVTSTTWPVWRHTQPLRPPDLPDFFYYLYLVSGGLGPKPGPSERERGQESGCAKIKATQRPRRAEKPKRKAKWGCVPPSRRGAEIRKIAIRSTVKKSMTKIYTHFEGY